MITPDIVELLCTDDTKRQLLSEGGGYARIYGPDGRLLSEPLPETTEGIVYADIDLSLITLAKTAADPAGHYARADVTCLLLDRTPRDPMVLSRRPLESVGRVQAGPVREADEAAEGSAASSSRKAG